MAGRPRRVFQATSFPAWIHQNPSNSGPADMARVMHCRAGGKEETVTKLILTTEGGAALLLTVAGSAGVMSQRVSDVLLVLGAVAALLLARSPRRP